MKREKLDIIADKTINSISRWCETKSIKYQHSGPYSMYIKIDNLIFDDIKNEIKKFLNNDLKISMKKIKKIISFSLWKDRAYILFKIPCELK